MGTVVVWYLLIMGYRTGVVAIPQISKESCLENARFISDKVPGYMSQVVCIPGAK